MYCELHAAATRLRILTGDGVATVGKTEHVHCDSSPSGVSDGVVHLRKIPCAAAIAAAIPQFLACCHGL